jgi:serine protease DegQ
MIRLLCSFILLIGSIYSSDLNLDDVSNAIVNVSAKVKQPLADVLDSSKKANHVAYGSGVIINSKQGYIVTNAHVIQDPELIIVTLNDGKRLKAKVIGKDKQTDLAVIQVDAQNLTAMNLSHSDVTIGQPVIAVGNPFGLDHTTTSGIISGKNRQLGQLYNLIQTDAPINPGNSGGALVNQKGELIGICTAITTISGGSIGLGFVIPIDTVEPITQQLIKHGNIERGVFGVVVQELSPSLRKLLSIDNEVKGVLVSEIIPESPAAKSNIGEEDIIIDINGHQTTNPNELKAAVSTVRVNESINIKLIRKNKPVEIKTKLENFNYEPKNQTDFTGADIIEMKALTAEGKIQTGLLVTNIREGSPAFLMGLETNDLITAINRQPVDSIATLQKILKTTEQGILISIQRNNQNIYLGAN